MFEESECGKYGVKIRQCKSVRNVLGSMKYTPKGGGVMEVDLCRKSFTNVGFCIILWH